MTTKTFSADTTVTFARLSSGVWGVRIEGPGAAEARAGDTVRVTKRSGETKDVVLAAVVGVSNPRPGAPRVVVCEIIETRTARAYGGPRRVARGEQASLTSQMTPYDLAEVREADAVARAGRRPAVWRGQSIDLGDVRIEELAAPRRAEQRSLADVQRELEAMPAAVTAAAAELFALLVARPYDYEFESVVRDARAV